MLVIDEADRILDMGFKQQFPQHRYTQQWSIGSRIATGGTFSASPCSYIRGGRAVIWESNLNRKLRLGMGTQKYWIFRYKMSQENYPKEKTIHPYLRKGPYFL
uniref:RNA helicase n=1 Tax=Meloidogyne floridensis TaxID=298350 RepID=A0A915NI73_9BILA